MSDDLLFVTTKINAVSSLDGSIKGLVGSRQHREIRLILWIVHFCKRRVFLYSAGIEDSLCARLNFLALAL